MCESSSIMHVRFLRIDRKKLRPLLVAVLRAVVDWWTQDERDYERTKRHVHCSLLCLSVRLSRSRGYVEEFDVVQAGSGSESNPVQCRTPEATDKRTDRQTDAPTLSRRFNDNTSPLLVLWWSFDCIRYASAALCNDSSFPVLLTIFLSHYAFTFDVVHPPSLLTVCDVLSTCDCVSWT